MATNIFNHLRRNTRHHRPHRSFSPTIRAAVLTPNSHITRDTSNHNNAPNLGPALNHSLRSQLRSMVDPHDINAKQFLVVFPSRIQEFDILVDASAGDAYIELAAKVFFKRLEGGSEGFKGGYIDVVVYGTDAKAFGDCEEGRGWWDYVEDGDVSTGLCKTFGEGEATPTGATGYEGDAALEGEL